MRRILRPGQMDLEYALWLVVMFVTKPKTAYRHVSYHKQTRDQWAREDPAFTVVCCVLQAVCALAWCLGFEHTVFGSVRSILTTVFVDLLLVAFAVATAGQAVANRFLRKPAGAGGYGTNFAVEQPVEWGYCFDVHLNSWIPVMLVNGALQYLLSPVLLRRGPFANALSVLLWGASLVYYGFLSFLGYTTLPTIAPARAKALLWWPLVAVTVAAPLCVMFGINLTRWYVRWFFNA